MCIYEHFSIIRGVYISGAPLRRRPTQRSGAQLLVSHIKRRTQCINNIFLISPGFGGGHFEMADFRNFPRKIDRVMGVHFFECDLKYLKPPRFAENGHGIIKK